MAEKHPEPKSHVEAIGTCCLCGGPYGPFGHNAAPLSDGRCCGGCNDTKVIPARLRGAGQPHLADAFERGLLHSRDDEGDASS
jgi:hypothetical protein